MPSDSSLNGHSHSLQYVQACLRPSHPECDRSQLTVYRMNAHQIFMFCSFMHMYVCSVWMRMYMHVHTYMGVCGCPGTQALVCGAQRLALMSSSIALHLINGGRVPA